MVMVPLELFQTASQIRLFVMFFMSITVQIAITNLRQT